MRSEYKKAIFAGGCFWCMEPPFINTKGVVSVVPGYTGGVIEHPTYEQVSRGETGHVEAVEVTYDQEKVSYKELLDVFWRQIDPMDDGGQFADRGTQYKTVIFYNNIEEKDLAEKSKKAIKREFGYEAPIATIIKKTEKFYRAEDNHKNYYLKNPYKFNIYKKASGRENFIKKVKEKSLKNKLTPLQFEVTQNSDTEIPFQNEYWDNTKKGIYVDVITGKPLFSWKDKYDSGCGWPSFTAPIEEKAITEKPDQSLGENRTEVRNSDKSSHLGHVFNDGPGQKGLRYCINSAALKFIQEEEMEKKGYGEYKKRL